MHVCWRCCVQTWVFWKCRHMPSPDCWIQSTAFGRIGGKCFEVKCRQESAWDSFWSEGLCVRMLLSLRTSLLQSLYKECIKQINSSSNHFTQTTLYISSELFAHASFTSAWGGIGPNVAGDSGIIGASFIFLLKIPYPFDCVLRAVFSEFLPCLSGCKLQ